jgi:lysophospholipase L1-like esterase
MLNRRNFITGVTTTTLASIALPEIVSAATQTENAKKLSLNTNDVIIFQGDSITDWGRNKADITANSFGMLGNGYTYLVASDLLLNHTDKNLKIYNRGVGGNKVYQLAERWDNDCLNYKPNVVSIMIGVNDFWHTLGGGYKGTIDTYRTDYKKLLTRTREALPNVKFVIGEPFAIKGVKAVDDKWYPAFDAYRQVSREMAEEFDAAFLPYQKLFDKAVETAPGPYWTNDGVHPTIAGANLMAHAWLKAVK